MRSRSAALRTGLAAALLAAACGYVADPQPPALNIPVPVADLRALQRSDRLIVDFTAPDLTTEGLIMTRPGEIDLRVGELGAGTFQIDQWAARAIRYEVSAGESGPVSASVPVDGWVGKEVVIAVRVRHPKGRDSDWSNLATLRVVAPLAAPGSLSPVSAPEGVQLSWTGSEDREEVTFRVFRRTGEEPELSEIARASTREWVDRSARYGQAYEYAVQAVLATGNREAESHLSPSAKITPEDRFPPAVPENILLVASQNSIELVWDRNAEPDLAAYRVYRAYPGGEFQLIAEVEIPGYSDRAVEPGRSYRFAVTAVDLLGNESARSEPVTVAAP